jgi:hypothetical protein
MSSSGLVPAASSKREENVYGPSYRPLASLMVPAPSLRFPFQVASDLRMGIDASYPSCSSSVSLPAGRFTPAL